MSAFATTTAVAQAIGSQPRAITLIATKAAAFDALDVVRVKTVSSTPVDGGAAIEVSAVVEIHDEGRCAIRVVPHLSIALEVSAPVPIRAAIDIGEQLSPQVFSGNCHESTPAHAMRIRVAGAARSAQRSEPGELRFEVECTRAGILRRWLINVPLGEFAPLP